MKSRLILLSLLVMLLALSMSDSKNKSFAQTTQAEWTLMFYMDLDNNLEAAQMDDIKEMLAVGSTKDVNIVLLVDRSERGSPLQSYTDSPIGNLKNWTTAKLLYVEKGNLRELGDWGEVNMGSPANVKKFLQTVTQQFPARRNAIIFTDHGAGWSGIVGDESANNDTLTTKELPVLFKEVGRRFDLIGFDACLMGNLEVAKSVAPFGRVMVGSEELEPADGWNYTPLFRSLTANPKMDEITLGKTIVNTYADYFKSPEQARTGKGVTLSVIALDKIEPLERAVNELGVRNQTFIKTGGRAAFISTAKARSNTEECGNDRKENYRYHYYDLGDYANNIKLEKPDAETTRAADAVIQATKAAVLHQHFGQGHPNSSGLAIYFPPDTKTLKSKDFEISYKETPFSLTGKWLPFLDDYTKVKNTDTQAPQLDKVVTDTKSLKSRSKISSYKSPFSLTNKRQPFSAHYTKVNFAETVATITSRVTADDVDEVQFIIAESNDNEEIIIGSVPTEQDEKGILREVWDGEWFTISDGEKELIAPITGFQELDDEDDVYWVEVPAQVQFKDDDEWIDVTLYFLLDFNEDDVFGEFIYAFEFSEDGVREIELDAGDLLRPVYVLIDENGDESLIASEGADDILKIKNTDELTVELDYVDAGKYLIGFMATDFAENISEEYTEVTIE
jgi:hypothetical protein